MPPTPQLARTVAVRHRTGAYGDIFSGCIARDFLAFGILRPPGCRAGNRSHTTIQLHKHETSNHWPSGEPPEDLRPATEDRPDVEETLVHRSALLDRFRTEMCQPVGLGRACRKKNLADPDRPLRQGREEMYLWFVRLAAVLQPAAVSEAEERARHRQRS